MYEWYGVFNDNCYELYVLRWFRDNFVSEEDKKHYYQTAPYIVEGIEQEENKSIVYEYIYENVVLTCIGLIEDGEYANAYNVYKQSILGLEETFARKVLEQQLIKTLEQV